MILLVGLYLDAHAARLQEFLTCIERNARHRTITAVQVFIEQDADPSRLLASHPQLRSPKVQLIVHGTRLTFSTLFEHANKEHPGRLVIVANADVFFDHTLARLDGYDLTGCLLCLSRWDPHADGMWRLFDFPYSQDAWIFQAPLPSLDAGFPLGVPGCDNRLAWQAEQAGLVVSNPSRSVRTHHLHRSGVRRYGPAERLTGPIRAVAPAFLEEANIPRWRAVEPLELGGRHTAAVAFQETMGFTIDRLALGASSHNNEQRPFTAIPETLVGRQFTQVVSGSASPVQGEFLSSGRLFVLAGTDWPGYYPATTWLSEAGRPEAMSLVHTRHQPAFEVWSLDGKTGDRFVCPTQVMLVSDYLERR